MDERTRRIAIVLIGGLGLCALVGATVLQALGARLDPSLGNVATAALAGILALLTPRNGGNHP